MKTFSRNTRSVAHATLSVTALALMAGGFSAATPRCAHAQTEMSGRKNGRSPHPAAVGSFTDTATVDTVTRSVTIPVTAKPTTPAPAVAASITLTLNASALTLGQTATATAVVTDAAGVVLPTPAIQWRSSNAAVATAATTGAATARVATTGVGTATILAQVSEAVRASVTVTVADTVTPPTGGPMPPGSVATGGSVVAELPRATVAVAYPTITRQVHVAAGADLQAAINAAQPGDELLLAPGATYTGNFVLPNKGAFAGWIVLRTDLSDAALGGPGTRMTPSRAAALSLARIVTPNGQAAIRTALTANHYRLTGLEIVANFPGNETYILVAFGEGAPAQTTYASAAHDLILDRSYLHGSSTQYLRRCLCLDSATSAVVDSWLADCHSNYNDNDSQAILGLNGAGPFLIQNNHLESGHEVIMWGGGDPAIPGLVPSDITIRGNHLTRPTSWKGVWQEKNGYESKNSRRVLLEGNVIENTWTDAQAGFAVLLKSTNQNGGCTWCQTADYTVRYNRITNVGAGFNIAAHPETYPVVDAARFVIHDNVIDNVNVGVFRGPGIQLQVLDNLNDLVYAHNSVVAPSGNSITMFDGGVAQRFTMHSNIQSNGAYGLAGRGVEAGTKTLAAYAPGATFMNNVIVGGTCASYPVGSATLCPSSWPTSTQPGFDGRPAGADAVRVAAATAGVVVAP